MQFARRSIHRVVTNRYFKELRFAPDRLAGKAPSDKVTGEKSDRIRCVIGCDPIFRSVDNRWDTMCNNGGAMRPRILPLYPLLIAFVLFLSGLSGFAQSSTATPSSPTQKPAPNTAQKPSPKTDDAMELVKQGEKLNAAGKPEEALALYQRALELSPNLYQAELFTGVALDLEGKYAEARQHLGKAIELASDAETTQALRVMAVSYAFDHNTEEASKYERRAFDLQVTWQKYEDAAATANELARIYLESGDLDNAFQWYRPAS